MEKKVYIKEDLSYQVVGLDYTLLVLNKKKTFNLLCPVVLNF